MLLRIIGRFCCSSLQKAWTVEFKETLEGLADEDNEIVRDVSNYTLSLRFFKFQSKPITYDISVLLSRRPNVRLQN